MEGKRRERRMYILRFRISYYVRKTTHYAFELLNVYVLWFTTKREKYGEV